MGRCRRLPPVVRVVRSGGPAAARSLSEGRLARSPAAVPPPRRLRLLLEMLAPFQLARRPRRHLHHRARRPDWAHPRPYLPGRRALPPPEVRFGARAMSGDFLLEIGCEEIPAWMLPRARASLKELLERELQARGLLQGKPVETFGTPRRLVAACARLAAAEPTRVDEVVGPPKSVAYDAAGKPTRAAESFAAKLGVKVSELKVRQTPKGAYVAVVSRKVGRPTSTVLAELVPSLILQIDFPRSMV